MIIIPLMAKLTEKKKPIPHIAVRFGSGTWIIHGGREIHVTHRTDLNKRQKAEILDAYIDRIKQEGK